MPEYKVMRIRKEIWERLNRLRKYPIFTFSEVIEELLDSYERQKEALRGLKEIKGILEE